MSLTHFSNPVGKVRGISALIKPSSAWHAFVHSCKSVNPALDLVIHNTAFDTV